MTKINQFIKNLCPNGVEYKQLHEFLKIKNGSDYKKFGDGDIPVYGSGGIITYVDQFSYDKPSVLIPRKGSIDKLYYVDTPFWNVDTIFYTDIDTAKAIPKYVYHCLLREHLEQYNTAGGVPSLTQKVLIKIKIPLPPLEIQEEIVRILDNFTELTTELTAELTARRKQYEYYRDMMLDFGAHDGASECKWQTLGDIIISLKTGLNPRQNFSLNEKGSILSYITGKDIYDNAINITERTDKITPEALNLINKRASLEKGLLLFASTGTGTVGRMAIIQSYDNDWGISETLYAIKVNEQIILTDFLMYYLYSSTAKNQFVPKISKGSVPHLKVKDLKDVEVPIPPIEEQTRIVNILDRFDKLCNDLTSGLPAEIEARRKQYEYYRDKLLSFEEM